MASGHFVDLREIARRSPVTQSLPQLWYRTANLHFLSILDFRQLCRQMDILAIRQACFNSSGEVVVLTNLFAEEAVTLLDARSENSPGKLP